MEIDIRACEAPDAQALSLVGSATFLESYAGQLPAADIIGHCARQHSAAVYERWLADPAYGLFVGEAREGRAPVGYAVVSPPDLPVALKASDLELKRIYLMHRFQGRGAGAGLLAAAVSHARENGAGRLLLGVWSNNAKALGFYQRQGFAAVGERRFQVGDNVYDDLVLALCLEKA